MGELSVPWMDDEAIRGNWIDSNFGLARIESKVFGHRPGFRTIRGRIRGRGAGPDGMFEPRRREDQSSDGEGDEQYGTR